MRNIFTAILTCALVLAALVAHAQTELNADSIVFNESQLLNIKFYPDPLGDSVEDNFPNNDWAQSICFERANALPDSSPWKEKELARCENKEAFGLHPDGFVLKSDSPYKDDSVPDGGQEALYTAAARYQPIEAIPSYDPSEFGGTPWDKLSTYRQKSLHLTKGGPLQPAGKLFELVFTTEVTAGQYGAYKDEVISKDGFDAPIAVLFGSEAIEINTRYLFGNDDAGVGHQNSSPPQIQARVFISNDEVEVYEKFIEDLADWNSGPKMQISEEGGVTTYSR